MKTLQLLFLSLTLIFSFPSQASLHNNNNVATQICLSCDETEGFSNLKYPDVFTIHKIDGKPHSFHIRCLYHVTRAFKQIGCPKCQQPLSSDQIARIEFAYEFPVDVAKKLESSDLKKLGDHYAKKAAALSEKAIKLLSPENTERLKSSISTQLEQRIRPLEKTIEKTAEELNSKNKELQNLSEQFDAKCQQVQNLYEQLEDLKMKKK